MANEFGVLAPRGVRPIGGGNLAQRLAMQQVRQTKIKPLGFGGSGRDLSNPRSPVELVGNLAQVLADRTVQNQAAAEEKAKLEQRSAALDNAFANRPGVDAGQLEQFSALSIKAKEDFLAGSLGQQISPEEDFSLVANLRSEGYNEDQIRQFLINREQFTFRSDPFGGTVVFDRFAGRPVQGGSPGVMPAAGPSFDASPLTPVADTQQPSVEPFTPSLDAPLSEVGAADHPAGIPTLPGGFEQGTGTLAFFQNLANTISEAVGAGQPFPEADEAINTLERLKVETFAALAAAVPGKETEGLRQRFESLAPTGASLFQGDERALSKAFQTRDFINAQVNRLRRILRDGRVPVGQQGTIRQSIAQLETLSQGYQGIIDGWWGQSTPEQRERGAGQFRRTRGSQQPSSQTGVTVPLSQTEGVMTGSGRVGPDGVRRFKAVQDPVTGEWMVQ